MAEENKVPKAYSLSPAVIAWVARKANRLTGESLENGGPKVSDSQLVEDILTEAMEVDSAMERLLSKSPKTKAEKRNRPAVISA